MFRTCETHPKPVHKEPCELHLLETRLPPSDNNDGHQGTPWIVIGRETGTGLGPVVRRGRYPAIHLPVGQADMQEYDLTLVTSAWVAGRDMSDLR